MLAIHRSADTICLSIPDYFVYLFNNADRETTHSFISFV